MTKRKKNLRRLWDYNKSSNFHVIGAPEEGEKEGGTEKNI